MKALHVASRVGEGLTCNQMEGSTVNPEGSRDIGSGGRKYSFGGRKKEGEGEMKRRCDVKEYRQGVSAKRKSSWSQKLATQGLHYDLSVKME